jgi:hypothetical protein
LISILNRHSWVQWFDNLLALYRHCDDVLCVEIHLHEIHHSDLAVLVSPEKILLGLKIAGRGPLRIIGQNIAVFVFLMFAGRALWNVELVQDMERLENGVMSGL